MAGVGLLTLAVSVVLTPTASPAAGAEAPVPTALEAIGGPGVVTLTWRLASG